MRKMLLCHTIYTKFRQPQLPRTLSRHVFTSIAKRNSLCQKRNNQIDNRRADAVTASNWVALEQRKQITRIKWRENAITDEIYERRKNGKENTRTDTKKRKRKKEKSSVCAFSHSLDNAIYHCPSHLIQFITRIAFRCLRLICVMLNWELFSVSYIFALLSRCFFFALFTEFSFARFVENSRVYVRPCHIVNADWTKGKEIIWKTLWCTRAHKRVDVESFLCGRRIADSCMRDRRRQALFRSKCSQRRRAREHVPRVWRLTIRIFEHEFGGSYQATARAASAQLSPTARIV